jgi:oligosaccharyltransferase complex subunit gamma
MARLRHVGMLVTLALMSLCAQRSSCAPQSVDPQGQVAKLLKLQQGSPDGVIKMDTAEWKQHVGGRSRPHSLVVFSSAAHLLDKPNLRLRELRAEFGYAAKGYRADAGTHGKVFLVEIEYMRTAEVFSRLPTKSLPYIFHVPPHFSLEGDGVLKVLPRDVMQASDYQAYPWTAHDIGGWVAETAGVKAAKIDRPSFVTHWTFPFVVLSVLMGGGAVAYKLYYSPLLKIPALWAAGIIFVFFFSVSGGMHNIIRGVPMQHLDPRTGKVVLFLKTGQSQLGAEGFIMGALYTTVGLCLALLTHGAPYIPHKQAQMGASFLILLVTVLCYLNIKSTYQWKTGHSPRWFI